MRVPCGATFTPALSSRAVECTLRTDADPVAPLRRRR
eukprot:gene37868-19459_t